MVVMPTGRYSKLMAWLLKSLSHITSFLALLYKTYGRTIMLTPPGFPASRTGHVVSFWPMIEDWKWQGGVFRNTFETGQLQRTHCLGFVPLLFFPPIFSCLGSRLKCQRDFWLCSYENGSSVEWRVGRWLKETAPGMCSPSEPPACGPSTHAPLENTSLNLFRQPAALFVKTTNIFLTLRRHSKDCWCYFHTYSSILWFTAINGYVRFLFCFFFFFSL